MQLARLHETPTNDERRSKMQLTTTVVKHHMKRNQRQQ